MLKDIKLVKLKEIPRREGDKRVTTKRNPS